MPFFEQNPLDKLAAASDEAEETLDLSGLSPEDALAVLEEFLASQTSNSSSFLIRFTAASDDGRETLFLPVGRRLLQARRDRVLTHCLPTSDGAAYHIRFRDPA